MSERRCRNSRTKRGSTSEVVGERKVRALPREEEGREKSVVGGLRVGRWIREGRGEGWEV